MSNAYLTDLTVTIEFVVPIDIVETIRFNYEDFLTVKGYDKNDQGSRAREFIRHYMAVCFNNDPVGVLGAGRIGELVDIDFVYTEELLAKVVEYVGLSQGEHNIISFDKYRQCSLERAALIEGIEESDDS